MGSAVHTRPRASLAISDSDALDRRSGRSLAPAPTSDIRNRTPPFRRRETPKGLEADMRTTLDDLAALKRAGEKIVMLTAYDYTAATLADRAGVPVLLVGDSLG